MKQSFHTADLARYLKLFILIGYPTVAAVVSVLPFLGREWTMVYRMLVLILSVSLFILAYRGGKTRIGNVLIFLFLGLYLLRLVYDLIGSFDEYLVQTAIIYCGYVLIPVTAVLMVNVNKESDKELGLLIVKFGLILTLVLSWIWISGDSFNPWADVGGEPGRMSLEILNPITIGQSAVTVFIAGMTLLIHFRVRGQTRLLVFAAIAMALLVLYSANSRGPIVSCIGALLWLSFGKLQRSWFLLAAFTAVVAYLALATDLLEAIIGRFDFDLFDNQSNFQRLQFQRSAIEAFFEAPVFGAFAIDPTLQAGSYPHNLFIETAMALGIIGLLVLFIIFIRVARNMVQFYNSEHPLLAALLVHYTLAFQFSGSLFAADAFFMLIGLACVARRRQSHSHLSDERSHDSRRGPEHVVM